MLSPHANHDLSSFHHSLEDVFNPQSILFVSLHACSSSVYGSNAYMLIISLFFCLSVLSQATCDHVSLRAQNKIAIFIEINQDTLF